MSVGFDGRIPMETCPRRAQVRITYVHLRRYTYVRTFAYVHLCAFAYARPLACVHVRVS